MMDVRGMKDRLLLLPFFYNMVLSKFNPKKK